MSQLLFDQELNEPIIQTILPVMSETGAMFGFIPIARTLFFDTLGPVMRAYGDPVLPRSVTVPSRGDDSTNMRVSQYVALVYTLKEVSYRPWLGLSELVSNDEQGYFSGWQMPAGAMINHFGRGAMLEALMTGMDTERVIVPPLPDPLPIPEVVSWIATVNNNALSAMSFFDFDWCKLFKDKAPESLKDVGLIKLDVVSNPSSGIFKASVVQSGAVVLGTLRFNTVRILRLNTSVPGEYLFKFRVTSTEGIHSCQLTLTVTP